MTPNGPADRANQRDQYAESQHEPALEAAWRAAADQPPHKESEIEAGGVHQQSLPNVGVPAQVHPAQAAGLIEMSKGPFQAFAAKPQQPLAPRAANAPSVPVHGVAGLRVLRPVPSPPIRFGDVAADAHSF